MELKQAVERLSRMCQTTEYCDGDEKGCIFSKYDSWIGPFCEAEEIAPCKWEATEGFPAEIREAVTCLKEHCQVTRCTGCMFGYKDSFQKCKLRKAIANDWIELICI